MGPNSATPGGAGKPDGSRHRRDVAAPTGRFRAVIVYLSIFTVSKGIAFDKLCSFSSLTLPRKHYYVIDCSKFTSQLQKDKNIFFSAATIRTFFCSKVG